MIAPTTPASSLDGHTKAARRAAPGAPPSNGQPGLVRRVARALLVAVVATAIVGALGMSRITVAAVQLAATYALRGTGFNAIGGGILAETDAQISELAQRYVGATYGPPPAPIIAVAYPAARCPRTPPTTPHALRA